MAGTGRSEAEEVPQLHLGAEDEEEQNEVLLVRRQRAAQAGSVLGMGRWGGWGISKAHQILSAPAGETEQPDVKKTIYRSYSC